MQTIKTFSYTVTLVDSNNGLMELLYSADGVGSVYINTPMPIGDQTVDDIASAYVPIAQWVSQLNDRVPVQVGHTNTLEVVGQVNRQVAAELWSLRSLVLSS